MKYFIAMTAASLLLLGLTGCGGSSSGDDNNAVANNDNTTAVTNRLVNIANTQNNAAPVEIQDDAQLTSDIAILFGDVNAVPITIADEDTLSTVLTRVQGTN
jgi:hypothetical protein